MREPSENICCYTEKTLNIWEYKIVSLIIEYFWQINTSLQHAKISETKNCFYSNIKSAIKKLWLLGMKVPHKFYHPIESWKAKKERKRNNLDRAYAWFI